MAVLACCQPSPTPLPVRRSDERRSQFDAALIVSTQVAERTRDVVSVDSVLSRRARFRIERVAGLDATRMFALSGEQLFHVRQGRWEPLSIDGGVARDVIATRGALWLLVEGRGHNAGRAWVLRSSDGDALTPVMVATLPRTMDGGHWSVRAMSAVGTGFVIAGSNPALVRVDSSGTRIEYEGGAVGYQRVRVLADDAVVCTRDDGDIDVLRYGTRTTVASDGLLSVVTDVEGFGYVVHESGAVWRGRPAKEMRRVVGPAPFEPRVAAMLRDGRLALVGDAGPLALSRGAGWQVIPGDWPVEPVAILPGEVALVVGRDGRVVALEGQGRPVIEPYREE
jgi:hypothetical protein